MAQPKLSTFPAKCENCKNENTECVAYKRSSFFGLFTGEIFICQSCISRAFRSFKKGK